MDTLGSRDDLFPSHEDIEGITPLWVLRIWHCVERPHLQSSELLSQPGKALLWNCVIKCRSGRSPGEAFHKTRRMARHASICNEFLDARHNPGSGKARVDLVHVELSLCVSTCDNEQQAGPGIVPSAMLWLTRALFLLPLSREAMTRSTAEAGRAHQVTVKPMVICHGKLDINFCGARSGCRSYSPP